MAHELKGLRMIATTDETPRWVGRVTPADGNIFLDLGFPPDETARLLTESDREIAAHEAVKRHLVVNWRSGSTRRSLRPVAAASSASCAT